MEYQQEIDQHRQLDVVLKPTKLHRADAWQHFVCEEERSLDQAPEPPHIKEEQEELWIHQKGEQLPGPEEPDIKFPLNALPVKSEDDEEYQSSQLHPTQNVENRDATTSTGEMKIKSEKDCGATDLEPPSEGLLPSSDCSENETEDSDADWKEARPSGSELSMQRKSERFKGLSVSKKMRSKEPSNIEKSATQIPFSHACKVCGKYFLNSMTLMRHVRIHSRECGLCGKHLKPGVNLKMHFEVHKQCIVCSKICSSISGLERHMKVHTGEKLFRCTFCEKGFIHSTSLKRHMTSHTGERSFTCTLCKKGFNQSGILKTHMRIHSGEKPFKCTLCENAFTNKATLNQHMRIHTGERPFSCKLCEKRFTQRVSLDLHMTTHTGEKPFTCTVCKKGFTQKVSLKTHMTTHTGEKPFTCTVCEKGFSQKVSLKTHMRCHNGAPSM